MPAATDQKARRALQRDFRAHAAILKDADEGVVNCRANGHWWKPDFAQQTDYGWYIMHRCRSCDSFRHQHLDKYGVQIGGSSIIYSEEFSIFKGKGHNTGARKGAARIESITRKVASDG